MIKTKLAHNSILALTMTLFSSGCATDWAQYRSERERAKVEDGTPQFDPAYFRSEESKHVAVTFKIFEGGLAPSDEPAQIRPGRMPYRSTVGGDVMVIYRDGEGKEIGRYGIEDPVLARSCDFDEGEIGATKPISLGTAEILIPYNPAIATIEIGQVEGQTKQFDIRPQLKRNLVR